MVHIKEKLINKYRLSKKELTWMISFGLLNSRWKSRSNYQKAKLAIQKA